MKKLCTICIIFVLIMLYIVFVPSYSFGYQAQQQNDPTLYNDGDEFIVELYNSLDNMLSIILQQSSTTGRATLLGQFAMGRPYLYFFDSNTSNAIYLAVYDPFPSRSQGTMHYLYNNNGQEILTNGYIIPTVHTFKIDLTNKPTSYSVTIVNNNENLFVPAICYNYCGQAIFDTLKDVGYINGDASLSDLQSGLAQVNISVIQEGDQTQQAIGTMQNQVTQTQQETTNAIGSMQNSFNQKQQQTTNAVGQMSNTIDNRIQQQQAQEQSNFNTLTNTTYYDNTTTVIDPDDFFESTEDPNDTTGFLQTLYDLVYEKFSNPSRSTVVVIPMPYNMEDITLDSSSVVDFYNTYTIIGDLVTTFWYFIIGRYIFEFCRRIYLFFVTGAFADTSLLSEYLSMHNEIIKTYMM